MAGELVASNARVCSYDRPMKIFVKPSDQSHNVITRIETELNFKGDEAKVAYENIISSCTEATESSKKRHLTNHRNKKQKRTKTAATFSNETLSRNSIFKAVEQSDEEFLRLHVNRENVNNWVDQYGWTLLMSSACTGNIRIVEFLLNLGASCKATECTGQTATDLALKKNYPNIVNLINNYSKKKKTANTIQKNERPVRACKVKDKIKEFYCTVCKETIKNTTERQHEGSVIHIFNENPGIESQVNYGLTRQNKGFQIMLNRGWDCKGGLGPDGSGRKYPIKTILKRDRKGLGESSQGTPRITHILNDNEDRKRKYPKPLRKNERTKLMKKEAIKDRALRRALA